VSSADELLGFIGSSFRSVWALELLLVLKREKRAMSRDELESALRASELVINQSVEGLVAAGLASVEGDGVTYMPVSEHVAKCVDGVEELYAARPNAVRRAIIASSASGATAFADAFRLRKE
jgi:hypothetical protein